MKLPESTRKLVESEALAHLVTLNPDVYLGPDMKFPPMDEPPPGHVLRITVDRLGGVGPWAA